MATTIFQNCKNRKREPRIFGFHSFASRGLMMDLSGPFRENIRSFLHKCGELEDYSVVGNPIWCTLLVNERNGVVFPLYTIEETVKRSSRSFCDHCRYVGWSHHFVSKRRYHLIIPVDDDWNKPLTKDTLDLYTHPLHGLIHCNGIGHLLCINGLEDGSNHLRGSEIMDLFDCICTILRAWKITVRDVSEKRSMDLRLLHSVAYGHPWFRKWSFKFYHGSFGVTENKYNRAVEILRSLDLNKIIDDFVDAVQGREIQKIICCYRDASETQMITIGELLQFMLAFKSKPPIQRKTIMALAAFSSKSSTATTTLQHKSSIQDIPIECETFASSIAKLNSRWPTRRLEYAAKVIVDVLKENKASINGNSGMSRQELRDAARRHIGDTGLIDFVLKSINTSVVGSQIVRRSIAPETKMLKFTIQGGVNGGVSGKENSESPPLVLEPGVDVDEDIWYLYRYVLLGYPESNSVSLATRVVLDSKHFVKEWLFMDEGEDKSMRLKCRVLPSYNELETELTRPLPPGVLVVVPRGTTVGELKVVAQSALRDTYCIMEGFVVGEIEGLKGSEEEEVLSCAGGQVWVKGCGLDLDTRMRYEGGPDNWTVDCGCGAKDDDGERMVACDGCQVWQHTRCSSIDDDEGASIEFFCARCSARDVDRSGNWKIRCNSIEFNKFISASFGSKNRK